MLTATREKLVLDTPRSPLARGIDTKVFGIWEHRLRDDFEVGLLPYIPYLNGSDEVIEESIARSKEMLSSAGGLVVANSEFILELDRSVLTHMGQAEELGLPVFMQTPYEEVAPAGLEPPSREMIVIGSRPDLIRDRLELRGEA